MSDKKKAKSEPRQHPRLRMLLEGLATAGGSAGGGVLLLALIGLVPGHQESSTLQPVLWGVSLAMILGTVWGIWMVIKGILGLK